MSIPNILDFLHRLDSELYGYIDQLGLFIYLILFLIVFGKTGFVILTFLPGDSLVFASGTIAAMDRLSVFILFILFFSATSFADSNNYLIGKTLSKFSSNRKLFLKIIPQTSIEKAKEFLLEYDRVAITFSRFIPLMRTMTPFICGFTGLPYKNFVRYNVIGALIWTTIWLGTGFALGNVPWIENNLLFTLSCITMIMFIPSIYGFLTQFRKKHLSEETLKEEANR
ncbi:membrane-associated protein [Ureibacillus xyleni]|uniref:Membrane-associated protein n=1 Tax=Ureibacillus xyleni TaxID=614648 RepID=A0A285SBU1_9BACL|nr:VTT domain-containing protein [Ureibacillus xyleni]SOC05176.1 membrane-associated protein [Ureibacillus xyleni]